MSKDTDEYTIWDRLKLAYYAFMYADKMPFKLVKGTEFETTGRLPPSTLEALGVRLWLTAIDENGKETRTAINPFSVFGR